MTRGLAALGLAALLLAPLAAEVAPAFAQGNASGGAAGNATAPPQRTPQPVSVPFTPLPPVVLAVGFRWLDDANRTIADYARTHPDQNTSNLETFRDGGWDFLNESRLTLAMSQFMQLDVLAKVQPLLVAYDDNTRREPALQATAQANNESQAALAAFYARLHASDAGLHTTTGVEDAVAAAHAAGIGDLLGRGYPNLTQQLSTAVAAEPRIVYETMVAAAAPSSYARFGGDLLDLALRADADPAAPNLPGGAPTLLARAMQRMALDPDSRSITGPASALGFELLQEGNRSGDAVLALARFVGFQEARASDGLSFRQQHNSMTADQLSADLQAVLDNATFVADYDGSLGRADPPGMLLGAQRAGYQGLFQLDGRNHAQYRVYFYARGDETYDGLNGAWDQLVGAAYLAQAEREAASPQAETTAQAGADWLLYGGVAVVAAVGVIAAALLRR